MTKRTYRFQVRKASNPDTNLSTHKLLAGAVQMADYHANNWMGHHQPGDVVQVLDELDGQVVYNAEVWSQPAPENTSEIPSNSAAGPLVLHHSTGDTSSIGRRVATEDTDMATKTAVGTIVTHTCGHTSMLSKRAGKMAVELAQTSVCALCHDKAINKAIDQVEEKAVVKTKATSKRTGGTLTAGTKMSKCVDCGKRTHQTSDNSTNLCRACFDAAGILNEHSDGHHDANPNIDECASCRAEDADTQLAKAAPAPAASRARADVEVRKSAGLKACKRCADAIGVGDTFASVRRTWTGTDGAVKVGYYCLTCSYYHGLPNLPVQVAAPKAKASRKAAAPKATSPHMPKLAKRRAAAASAA